MIIQDQNKITYKGFDIYKINNQPSFVITYKNICYAFNNGKSTLVFKSQSHAINYITKFFKWKQKQRKDQK